MNQTATIYWSVYDNVHHTLISEVQSNGEHVIVQSKIHDNHGQTLDKVKKFWIDMLGESNVRAYTIKEHIVDVGRYSNVG